MMLEDEVRMSFYREIATVDERHSVVLVQHTDTGKIYVKKTLAYYDYEVFEIIRDGHFQGIPVIKELIRTDDALVVIEDYISGQSLDELLATRLFSEEETASIINALCDILEPIHSHNPPVIHRDIKGSNVIIDNEGKVYLIDFDASKKFTRGKSRDTDLIGTEEYAAPEQYGFGQSDQRTDIYALGVLMNKLLTGKFPAESRYQGTLAKIITKATAIDPKKRYQNVRRLKEALRIAGFDAGSNVQKGSTIYEQAEQPSLIKRLLSHLPYPVRELPGFRSGKPLNFVLASVWYALLIACGFFGVIPSTKYTLAQNRFYDITIFFMLFIPTLYVGNYLGIRDSLPWLRTANRILDNIRISIGVLMIFAGVIILASIAALILHY